MGHVMKLEGIEKNFGSIKALQGVDLEVREGEVLALLGDNGAGKSTLIKTISGIYPIDGGQITVDGKAAQINSPKDAMNLGIETIHQDTSLAPDLSIARNLFLGREPVTIPALGVFAPLDLTRLKEEAAKLLKRVGISKNLDADAPVASLSGGERQSIAISRAMQFFAKLIILDEPTNNLGVEETNGVLKFIREVREAGHSVIYITHNIHHVMNVADRAVVMRQGRIVADLMIKDTDLLSLEAIIMGAEPEELAAEMRGKAH
ncbi:ATP-binding cassette domain-containing protein [Shimia biformata]|uniref:ATP-binding cassette domain-containing protein n=1 Tax=Shimia biformata TaxID=1294299 RepID=UPI0019508EB5|nr:ATP-binding cassette domain-containing protein [Shimia biformata]